MPISQTVHVQATADTVWGMVSDLPRMGQLSPENTGGTWRGGASGPAVGARFKGRNRSGRRRWSTDVKVVRCVPGQEFAFVVSVAGLSVAEWAYVITPAESGVSVTETWTDQRGRLITTLGGLTTGVSDRKSFTASSIATTLAAVKVAAES